ncbi:alpha/beta fold hydrolase [Streptomyces gamaensis]|uniref:Alpha/beta fold hydrolase n=1 Tax=Streptomyces gamaensis TaxID=1763542 RepID=A0ABW0Z376_9ACTN
MKLRLPRRRGRLWAAVAAGTVLLGAGTWTVASATGQQDAPVHREDRFLSVPESPGEERASVRVDTSFFTAGGAGRRPAVLLAHGFGGSKDDLRGQAEELARSGYAVLTWSARGFGRSTGRIGLNDPEREVADVSRLVDWLARRPEVRLDADGDPRVGIAGASYGGAVALLAAGHDRRIDAIAPQITYWDLADSLFPGDVFKKLWSGVFFTTGASGGPLVGKPQEPGGSPEDSRTGPQGGAGAGDGKTGRPGGPGGCGRFAPELCAMYERVAVAGRPDTAARQLLQARSPSAVAGRIKVPALLVQGQRDSLFPLEQSDAAARAIAGNGAPVAVDWVAGGHDGGFGESGRIAQRTRAWFDRYLKGDAAVDTGPVFRVTRSGGIDSTEGGQRLRGASADRYPGLRDAPREVALSGREQLFSSPPGAAPPAISAVPGVGALSRLSGLGVGVALDFPGQYARFDSAPLDESVRVTGSPTVRVTVSSDTDEAVLFAKVYDAGPDGQQVLPAQLVAPVRVTGARGGREVELRLPAVDHTFEAGHRMRLVLASTDLGYASPAEPAAYTVALAGSRALSVPTAPGVRTAGTALPWWVWGLPSGGVLLAGALLLVRRRTAVPPPDPALADVPLVISGLNKRYTGSAERWAVRELSFRVGQGQVLGLLGPNGAGKTTTLRMLMGLIRPDSGEIRLFGHAVRPGAPVLSRVGAFVEGAGFLPHLSGRANLELYWRATGRPARDARLDEALEIAGLGDALERAVRTYSQGMRQRLALAQAMLGLPDLLILDEPTNGLDPPQIREMREVMTRYAAAGRTVIVSSHLLAEVEQSCTHLVVMDRGRLVASGPVADIVGSGETVLVGIEGGVSEVVAEKVAALPGVASAVRGEEGLLVRLAGLSAAELLVELVRLEVPVARLGPHRRLEDAFLTLIGDPS